MSTNRKTVGIGTGIGVAAAIGVTALFLVSAEQTLVYEDGAACVDHIDDLGGRTNRYGITTELGARYGYDDVCAMTKEQSLKVAFEEFWLPNRLEAIAAASQPVASELYDTIYNTGRRRGVVRDLQRCLNAANRSQRDYADVDVDGWIGPATVRAVEAHVARRGDKVLLRCLNGLQVTYYLDITEKRAQNESFFNGWIAQRAN